MSVNEIDSLEGRGMGFVALQRNRVSPMENDKTISRKLSVKEAWEENVAQKTQELKDEQRKIFHLDEEDYSETQLHQSLKSIFSWRRILNIFRPKRFRDRTLESLYRRYFLKVDQSSQSIVQILSIIICILLIIFFYLNGLSEPFRGIVLGLVILIFIAMEILLYHIRLNFLILQIMCLVSVVLLLAVVCAITVDLKAHDVADGTWVTLFFVYMIYTGIPVSMSVAVIAGILLPLAQISFTTKFSIEEAYGHKQVSIVCTRLCLLFCLLHLLFLYVSGLYEYKIHCIACTNDSRPMISRPQIVRIALSDSRDCSISLVLSVVFVE